MDCIKAAERVEKAVTPVAKKASLAAMLGSALMAGTARAAKEYNLQPPVTPIGEQIYDLHIYIMWICVVIFIGVFAVMFYSIFAHRRSKGHQAAQFHENTMVEVVWTIIPFFILLFMAFPATKTILAMKDTTVPDMTIKVTGYQWKWGYEYMDTGVTILSTLSRDSNRARQLGSGIDPNSVPNYLLSVDHPLVVPAGVKVRVLITAQDVIHSWWVPALAIKKDAIPGFINEAWFDIDADKTGTYRGQCAELCGRDHGFMPIVLEVKSKADFDAWLQQQRAALKQPPDTTTQTSTAPTTTSQAMPAATRPSAG
jgi:cytochrome c oxidase subunit 2